MTHRSPQSTPLRGFTLIEFLVVIAVLVLLCALLFPIYGNIQRAGRATQCVGNLRALSAAAFQYSADNDGFLLPAGQEGSSSYTWIMILQKYLEDTQYTNATQRPFYKASYCPDFYIADPRGKKRKDKYQWTWSSGYSMNGYPGATTAGIGVSNRVRLNSKGERVNLDWTGDFRLDTIAHKDVRPWIMDGSEWQVGTNPAQSSSSAQYGSLDYNRHGKDSSNVLFFDGHVESGVPMARIKTGLAKPDTISAQPVL